MSGVIWKALIVLLLLAVFGLGLLVNNLHGAIDCLERGGQWTSNYGQGSDEGNQGPTCSE